MCRVVAQGQRKSPNSRWVNIVPWAKWDSGFYDEDQESEGEEPVEDNDDEDSGDEPAGDATPVATLAPQHLKRPVASSGWTYGFCTELLLPYRYQGGTDDKTDTGLPVNLDAGGAGTDLIIGEWPDGHKATWDI